MKKEFAPYDRALKIKALGFDEPCFAWYVSESYGLEYGKVVKSDLIKDGIVAPTFSQAFRWFREEYSLGHEISCPYSSTHFGKNVKIINEGKFEAFITDEEQLSFTDEDFLHDTYEEAELACLDKLIEIVELKQEAGKEFYESADKVITVKRQKEPRQETFIKSDNIEGQWLSPVVKERAWQEEQLVNIFGHYPNASPRWQYMNGLIQNSLDAEQMYTKEEVLEHLNHLIMMTSSKLDEFTNDEETVTMKWFEQFKQQEQ